jgi:hypothetical protein
MNGHFVVRKVMIPVKTILRQRAMCATLSGSRALKFADFIRPGY